MHLLGKRWDTSEMTYLLIFRLVQLAIYFIPSMEQDYRTLTKGHTRVDHKLQQLVVLLNILFSCRIFLKFSQACTGSRNTQHRIDTFVNPLLLIGLELMSRHLGIRGSALTEGKT